jgi:uncharacterized protein YggE
MRTIMVAIWLAASLGAAQLDPNTVTVTAVRTLTVQPDQVVFLVNFLTAQDSGLDDVLAKLKGTGITAAQLAGVGSAEFARTNGRSNPVSLWSFILPVSFDKMQDTMKALLQAQSAAGSQTGGQALTFSTAGVRISPEQQAAQQCPLPALVSDARRQADAMAAAAGMRTGAIVSVSDGSSVDGVTLLADPTTALRADFLVGLVTSSFSAGTPQPVCSLTIQFKLLP